MATRTKKRVGIVTGGIVVRRCSSIAFSWCFCYWSLCVLSLYNHCIIRILLECSNIIGVRVFEWESRFWGWFFSRGLKVDGVIDGVMIFLLAFLLSRICTITFCIITLQGIITLFILPLDLVHGGKRREHFISWEHIFMGTRTREHIAKIEHIREHI